MYCLASNNRKDNIFKTLIKTGHAPCDDSIIAGNHMLLPSMLSWHYAKLFSLTANENKGSPVVWSHEAISNITQTYLQNI